MMILGIMLFALGIIISIVLHEYGHYRVALWSGMRVRRFFVGFGPTLWSTRREVKGNGEVEFGFKAIPLGGFCDIAGMTAYDPLDPADESKAMYRQSAVKRIAVLLAGPVMNIALAIVLFYIVAVGWGLANTKAEPLPPTAVQPIIGATCDPVGQCSAGAGPAGKAGLKQGDRITEVNGIPINNWLEIPEVVGALAGKTVPVTVNRDGRVIATTVAISAVAGTDGQQRGALGVRLADNAIAAPYRDDPRYQRIRQYDVVSAVPATFAFTGEMIQRTAEGLASFPGKIPGVVQSIFGGQREEDSPVSVVGASHVGGQVAERGLWDLFLLLLAGINLFIGIFNLIPLTPFDGGHIAVVLYEKIRDAIRKMRGLAPGGPADYEKLAPLTMAVFVVLIAVSAVVIVADIVNPIMVPG